MKEIHVGMNALAPHVNWRAVMRNITSDVIKALFSDDEQEVIVNVPSWLYESLLKGWASAYISPPFLPEPDESLFSKILGLVGLTTKKERKVTTLTIHPDAIHRVYLGMKERRSLIVNGRYIPVVIE